MQPSALEMAAQLSSDVASKICACIVGARGAEICGYLVSDGRGVQDFLAIENRLDSRDGCFVSSGDARRALKYAERRALTVTAFVHSHAAGNSLSHVDREGLKQSDLPWIIVALTDLGLVAVRHDRVVET